MKGTPGHAWCQSYLPLGWATVGHPVLGVGTRVCDFLFSICDFLLGIAGPHLGLVELQGRSPPGAGRVAWLDPTWVLTQALRMRLSTSETCECFE